MQVLVTGASCMLGRKLAQRFAGTGSIGSRAITRLRLHDIVEPTIPTTAAFSVETAVSDLSVAGEAEKLVADQPEVIFHLAAMPGLAKSWTDFDLYSTCNIQATQRLLEAVRRGSGKLKRFVYISTSSVYGRYAS